MKSRNTLPRLRSPFPRQLRDQRAQTETPNIFTTPIWAVDLMRTRQSRIARKMATSPRRETLAAPFTERLFDDVTVLYD
ncbi:unnamed protein product [Caenorhabditis auriculariae]|uniref:Uncharacterized protein n=1 Tax=Caenorhabditis auriculariae TaxID=2777116 RepID=A0A8S1HI76_9PELO|nr:unnamed protein product [Caenorhabditis auriculariae]